MRFTTLSTVALAATAYASPATSPSSEGVAVVDKRIVVDAEAVELMKKDQSVDLGHDLSKLVGDVVYDVEGILNSFGLNVTSFFNDIGLQRSADAHGELIDATRLIVDVTKDLAPIAIRFGINLLNLANSIL